MTAIEIAREYFPDVCDDDLDGIIWSYTGFPGFWNIPKDGNTPEECLRYQLKRLKLARDTGRWLCETCGSFYVEGKCNKCDY